MQKPCTEELEYDREAAAILAKIDAAAAAAAAAVVGAGQQQPAADTQPSPDQSGGSSAAATAACGSSQKQPGSNAAADAEAAAASREGEGDADLESELLSDLDTEDGTAEEVEAADVAALRELRRLQKSTHRLVSKAAFTRVAQDVLRELAGGEFSLDTEAVDALQRACESYLVDAFESSNMCAIHAERQKVTVKDMRLASRLTDPNMANRIWNKLGPPPV